MAGTRTRVERAEIEAVVGPEMERWQVPGLAIGLYEHGEQRCFGFGVRALDTGQPVTPGTLFQAGSISKVFTATVLMQLVDEGRLALDAPVVTYLPELRMADAAARDRITPRHLLTHTAGFYGDRFEDDGPGDDAIARGIAQFHTLRQLTPPGETWSYCNAGFQLLGGTIERVLDTTFEAAMRRRVLEPLGLTRTCYFAHEAITYPVAVGHTKLPDQDLAIARAWARPRGRNPQGGVITTVEDLLRFAELHLDPPPSIGGETLRAMQEPRVEAGGSADAYGLAWQLRRTTGEMLVGHGGSTNGFRAALALLPERRAALAILTNGSLGFEVCRAVEAWWLARFGLRRAVPAITSISAAALARVAGRYAQPLAEIEVTVAGDRLRVAGSKRDPFTRVVSPLPPIQLAPVSETRFLVVEGEGLGETVDFLTGDDGRIRFLRLDGRLADRV